jgi:hypothetical protein
LSGFDKLSLTFEFLIEVFLCSSSDVTLSLSKGVTLSLSKGDFSLSAKTNPLGFVKLSLTSRIEKTLSGFDKLSLTFEIDKTLSGFVKLSLTFGETLLIFEKEKTFELINKTPIKLTQTMNVFILFFRSHCWEKNHITD